MRHLRRVWCVVAVAVVVSAAATPVSAQSGHNLERPEHWKARFDDADGAGGRRFVVMRPGWHVFAGPGGLLWDPGSFASGSYGVSSTIFLFPEGDPERSDSTRLATPYGLFLGGRDLEGEASAHLSFQIDNAGRFRVAEHTGDGLRELVPWTVHDGIAVLGEEAQSPAENVLAVDVRGEKALFYVNDAAVAELPADQVRLEGVVGLQAGARSVPVAYGAATSREGAVSGPNSLRLNGRSGFVYASEALRSDQPSGHHRLQECRTSSVCGIRSLWNSVRTATQVLPR